MSKEKIIKGWVFTYGVDGFGADTAPAYEEGCYLDFDKAFKHLIELNHEAIFDNDNYGFYEEGYGIDFYPSTDKELTHAEETENWELYDKLINSHKICDEREINKQFINTDPQFDMYALEEIEIIK